MIYKLKFTEMVIQTLVHEQNFTIIWSRDGFCCLGAWRRFADDTVGKILIGGDVGENRWRFKPARWRFEMFPL